MGFSLSSDRRQILMQNRSHYVNPSSHEQFKKLGNWLEAHRGDLYHVLDCDPLFPERYILYGEWLAATHSIPYTRLPDLFLAFDLYDRAQGLFISRVEMEHRLAKTTIQLVPLIQTGVFASHEDLQQMVQRPSVFYDGVIEGVYVKIEDETRVISRGKVVRGDFISGNEHWARGPIKLNSLGSAIEL
jgi:atypical dual specificity phosphatase